MLNIISSNRPAPRPIYRSLNLTVSLTHPCPYRQLSTNSDTETLLKLSQAPSNQDPALATMTAVIESVVAIAVFVTITAIMAAHHAEERLKQRFTMNGNKYNRFNAKIFRLQERCRRREPPSRHYCPHGHPLD